VKQLSKFLIVGALPWAIAMAVTSHGALMPGVATTVVAADQGGDLNSDLRHKLGQAGFTGEIEQEFRQRLEQSLGRRVDQRLAELGRLLWFDKLHSNGRDNTCAGCHSPTNGMGDSQPMAIGVQSNLVVGPHRTGPRNQRRSPTVVNNALYPRLMWNNRFEALTGNPFDGSQGFSFPAPEGDSRFSPAENRRNDVRHLLQAQAHIPPTELIEVAGFEDACNQADLAPNFCQFDLTTGPPSLLLPLPDASGFRNEPIRQVALAALNANAEYRRLFGQVFKEVKKGAPIDFFHFGKAIAEFEFTLVFANAPLDRFARGDAKAMTSAEKRGALLFFGKANCVSCHRVDGNSNEMFSDFKEHVLGVPQVFPSFGVNTGNFPFSGEGMDEDFGREERTGNSADRYEFRTAPLRNLAVSAGFFHNGAFVHLDDAIRFHLNVVDGAKNYDPADAGVPADLQQVGPLVPKNRIASSLRKPIKLTNGEFNDLVQFVRTGLLDERVKKSNLCGLIPRTVPSGLAVLTFEGCPAP
jgi:cytochrome c peroxidase